MKSSSDGELLLVKLAAELLDDERVLASSERGLLFSLLEESRTESTGNAELDAAVSRRLVSAVAGSMAGRIVNALADELVRQLLARHGGGRWPGTNMAPQVSPSNPGNTGGQVSPSNPGNYMAPQVSPSNPGNTGGQVSPSNPGNYMAPQVSPSNPGNTGGQVSPSNPGNLQAPEPSAHPAADAVPGAKSQRKR